MQQNKEFEDLNPLPVNLNLTEPNEFGSNRYNDPGMLPIKGSVYMNKNPDVPLGSYPKSDNPNPINSGFGTSSATNNYTGANQSRDYQPGGIVGLSRHFFGQRRFTYANIPDFVCDIRKILLIALCIYLLEYLLIFGFSLGAYLRLQETFNDTHWVIGLIFLILYLILSMVNIVLVGKRMWVAAFIVKFWEFASHLMLLGWCSARLEFAFLSLSYMMVFSIILLIVWVG